MKDLIAQQKHEKSELEKGGLFFSDRMMELACMDLDSREDFWSFERAQYEMERAYGEMG
jgi:hypothetical protein